MKDNPDAVTFLNSYKAETSIVPEVISKLINDLLNIGYPQADIDEIVLAMDESITNAIQETLIKRENSNHSENAREITIRYTIDKNEFDATVIDHGCGLDIINSMEKLPDETSNNYYDQIIDYAEKSKLNIRVNGEKIPLRGIGTGLKIILQFMDHVSIDLIDKKKILSNKVSKSTDGTILNMRRSRKY